MSGRFPCILVAVAALHVSLGAQNRASERFQLAVGLIDRGMHDDAAKQLERFLEEQPQHANRDEAQYRLGCCYLKLDKPAKAVAALRAALGGGAGFELLAGGGRVRRARDEEHAREREQEGSARTPMPMGSRTPAGHALHHVAADVRPGRRTGQASHGAPRTAGSPGRPSEPRACPSRTREARPRRRGLRGPASLARDR